MEQPNKQPNKPRGRGDLPDLASLSLPEMEALIARKRQEETPEQPSSPVMDDIFFPMPPRPTKPPKPAPKPVSRPLPKDISERRFQPTGLEVQSKRPGRLGQSKNVAWRNVVGYTLEGLVILAVLLVVGGWLLQQFGISLNFFDFLRGTNEISVLPLQADGLLLSASAPGVIMLNLPATATPAPATPTATTVPTTGLVTSEAALAVTPTAIRATATTTLAPTGPTPIVAPTPTPFIVQAKPVANPAGPTAQDDLSRIIAKRLVIPRLGLDSPVQEVTVDLGTWQVADFAVGHHLGTANPGQPGNMVLAGHRDIRGSVFLRLNEIQVGDDFKVFTDSQVYRYIVTGISEVAPTAVSVMEPTVEPTATLITCTPIGFATRRLIIKAKLQN